MRRGLVTIICLLLVAACGGAGEAGSQEPADSPQEAVDRVVAGESPAGEASGNECAPLVGVLPELIEIDMSTATVTGKDMMGHALCRINWPVPPGAKRYGNEVSLTVMGTVYDSPEAAVASLESAVSTLTEGVDVEVGGETRTVKSGFGDWVEGVGNRAITKKQSILVAAGDRRFTLAVVASDDDAENQRLAIELAKRVAEAL